MISFELFLMEDGIPIYLQIIQYIKRGIVAGTISDHSEMPSRRTLSALLGVNPNTIQKAYRILEDEGLIESKLGAKSFLTIRPEQVTALRGELLVADTKTLVTAMKQMGISKEEALSFVAEMWE